MKDALHVDEVAQSSPRGSEAREDEQIGIDDPVRTNLRHTEIVPNGGQGDTNHGLVEHDNAQDPTERGQDPPLAVIVINVKHYSPRDRCRWLRSDIRSRLVPRPL